MKKYRGLTLIEVLIASLILFTALGLVATVFQYNLMQQGRLATQLHRFDGFASVQAQIAFALAQGQREGSIIQDEEQLSWKATVLQQQAPITSFDFENNRAGNSTEQLQLLQITVNSEVTLPLEYKEVVWLKVAG